MKAPCHSHGKSTIGRASYSLHALVFEGHCESGCWTRGTSSGGGGGAARGQASIRPEKRKEEGNGKEGRREGRGKEEARRISQRDAHGQDLPTSGSSLPKSAWSLSRLQLRTPGRAHPSPCQCQCPCQCLAGSAAVLCAQQRRNGHRLLLLQPPSIGKGGGGLEPPGCSRKAPLLAIG